jgi:glycosyltransferase involved in cell wall biosynthesis
MLKKAGIAYFIIPFVLSKYFLINAVNTYRWGIQAKQLLKKMAKKDNIVLWIEGNYTFGALGMAVKQYPYILQHQEMFRSNLERKIIKKIINNAIVNVIPEYNRGQLYRMFFSLNELPVILPNKTYFLPDAYQLKLLKEKYREIYDKLSNKKNILFQGGVGRERDLTQYVRAIKLLRDTDDYRLVVLGKDYDGLIAYYAEIDNSLIHIDHVDAPDYLFITSLAYIGIITYTPASLNTLYCAPNKLFEYSAFGIPVVAKDIPGLKYTVEYNNFGIVVDESNIDSIIDAIRHITDNYDIYSLNGKNYYNSVDNEMIIKSILKKVEGICNAKSDSCIN